MTKKIIILFVLLFSFSTVLFSQTTSVTATITDSDGTTWTSAQWSVSFVTNGIQSNPCIYQLSGQSLCSNAWKNYLSQKGTSDANTGAISVTLLDNTQITPSGTKFVWTVQSNTSAPATQYAPLTISGASMNLSSYLSTNSIAPRFAALGPQSFGYSDVEVNPTPNPGAYYYSVTNQATRQWSGPPTNVWQNLTTNSWNGGTVSNAINAPGFSGPLNGIVLASNTSTPTSLPNPILSAGLNWLSTGGTVAANTYKAEVTYIGTNGQETLPSVLDSFNQYSVTTTGSTSRLFCNAQEASRGYTGFKCYIQTGGTGNFYLQGGINSLTTNLEIDTTPVTSGSIPPASNTATSQIAFAQASLSGGAGMIDVPTSIATSAGAIGDPQSGSNQITLDRRYGALNLGCLNGEPMKTSTYGLIQGCLMIDQVINPSLTIGQQSQAFSAVVHTGSNPFYGGGNNPNAPSGSGSALGAYIAAYGGPGHTESITGINAVVGINNQSAYARAAEFDCFNQSSTDATSTGGCVALQLANLGLHKSEYALWITEGNNSFQTDIRIEDSPFSSSVLGLYIGSGRLTGAQFESPILETLQTSATGFKIIPPDDLSNYAIQLTNHAGSQTVAYLFDTGDFSSKSVTSNQIQTGTASPALSGIFRLANLDTECWRNGTPGTGDLCLALNGSNQLIFGSNGPVAFLSTVQTFSAAQTFSSTLNITGTLQSNGTAGVTCSGSPTTSFATLGGIVTHC